MAGLLGVAVMAAGLALASGSTPAITLSQSGGGVLFGATQTVTLTAANPLGQTQWGYNLTYEAVLPANVSYVATTTPNVPAPTVLADEPSVGETTLIWANVADLSPNASNSLAFTVSHSTTALAPGSSYTITSGAYVNTDPRQVPQFDATGAAQGATFTGSATASQLSTISAIALSTAEPSPEGKLLRGVHSHRTVYTLTVQNNSVNQTTGIAVTEYLPADLEFLGCGTGDNTTNAPTNPGGPLEYPGAPALNAAGSPGGLTGCVPPTSVSTQTVTPPGASSSALYTVVVLPVGTLAAGASQQLQFVAAVPLRANTGTWNNVSHTAPSGIGQTANLDNNSGAETYHGEDATVYGQAAGNYDNVTPVSANSSLARTVMDVRILKSASSGALVQGADTTWTLQIDTGEYRYLTPVTVSDTVPNGLCPIDFATPTTSDGECQASSAGDNPSLAWDNTPSEQSDGTWVLHWTLPSTLDPDSSDTITYHTNTRTHYRSGGANTTAISSNDSLTNHVSLASTSFRKCINGNDECTGGSPVKIDGDTDGTADPDSDAASQTATAPTIAKTIQTTAAGLANCTTGTYGTTPPTGLAPGDKVCYELRVAFPATVDTQTPTVTDFLPPNLTYVAGSAAALGDDTVGAPAPTVSGNTVTWSLGSDVAPGSVFDVVLAGTIAQNEATYPDGYLTGNLMKTNFVNTPGAASSNRAQQTFTLAAPSIDLVKGVASYTPPGGSTVTEPGPNVDAVTVPGNSAVQWRVDVENQGGADATGEIWDRLPGPLNSLRCASVSGISGGGTCVTDAVHGDYIDWSSVALGAHTTIAGANQTTLTYTTSIGSAFSPSEALSSAAGVRDFTGTDNQGGTETYYPSANVDPAVTAGQENAPAAGDGSSVDLAGLTFTHTDSTGVNEAGNNLLTQATVGEDITYTDTLTVPDGTTLYDGPAITSALPPATLSATTAVSSAYSDNGSTTMPANWTTSSSGSSSPSLTFTGVGPSSWTNNTGHPATFTLTYTANVLQNTTNVKGSSIGDTSTLSYEDETGAALAPSVTDTVTVVEPTITATLTNAGGSKVSPGAVYTYTGGLTDANTANTSTAHDNTLIVTVPAGLSPWTAASGGAVVADGGSDNGWTWNLASRTLTYTPADVAAGSSATHTFFLGVDSPAISGASFQTSIEARTTSYPGTPPTGTERTYNTTPHAGYDAAASDTVVLGPPTLVKAVNPTTATFGTSVTYTVTVSLAANVSYYDATVLDAVPSGITYDGATSAPTLSCSAGCTGPSDTPSLATNASGSTVAFYLGVSSATPVTSIPASSSARTLVITFYGHVNNAATDGVGHTNNSVNIYDDASSKEASWPASPPAVGSFDQAGTASTAAVTVVEPTPAITKAVSSNDAPGHVAPGDSPAYTLTVKNTSATWPMYDVHVTDTPSSAYVGVSTAAGVSTTDNTTPWSAPGSTMAWDIPTIPASSSVTLVYYPVLPGSASLHQAQAIDNSASITTAYGLDAAGRAAYPAFKTYSAGPAAVNLTTDMPIVSVAQAPNGSSAATIDAPFTWKVTLTDTSAGAGADTVNLADILPVGWNYVAGSSQLAGVGTGDPSESGQTLTWLNLVASLAAGQSKVLTFQAIPTLQAALTTGIGAATNPHVAVASDTWSDATGSTSDADGAYASGPAPASAYLNPSADLSAVKTLDAAPPTLTEGNVVDYQIVFTNNTSTTGAYAMSVVGTDVLPALLQPQSVALAPAPAWSASTAYADGDEVSSGGQNWTAIQPSTNQTPGGASPYWSSEAGVCSIASQTVTCDWPFMGPGATRTVNVMAQVQPVSSGNIANTASVSTTSVDPNPANNSSTVTTTVQRPQLSIAKTYSGTTLGVATGQPGDPLTYDLAITNTGAATAYDATVSDQPDPALSAVTDTTGAADATSTWHAAGDSLGWTVPSIAAGQTVHLQYTATLSSAVHDGQSVANTASVTGYWDASATVRTANPGFAYTHLGGVTPSTATLTARVPTLTLADDTGAGGYPNSANAQVGQPFPWHLVFTNSSAATAHQVVVTDTLPADYVYRPGSATLDGTAIADPSVSGQTLTFTATAADVTMLAGAAHTIDFVSVPGTAAVNDPQPQTSHAQASWLDGAAGTASAAGAYQTTDATATANLVIPSLTITKTAAAPTADAGAPTTYTITVANHGTVPARHVNVADTLPSGESYTPGSATAIPSAGFSETSAAAPSLSWQIAQIDPGNSVAITLPVTLSGSLDAGLVLVNSVAATSDELATPVTATASLTVTRHVDVSLAKTGPAAIAAGTDATWTLVAHNAGPSDARAVVISDPLPAHTTFKSADPGCGATANTVTCTVGTLAADADATYHVTGTVDAAATVGATITNTATVTTSDPDTNPANNSATQTATVGNAVDLGITQTAAQAQVAQTLRDSFTLTITNAGPSDAYAAQVVDTLPAGLSYVSASPSQGSCMVSAQVVTCALGTVPVGTIPTIAIVVQANVPGQQTNAATVSTGLQTDTNPANNAAAATITVLSAADLAVTKTGPATVAAGGQATYVMTATDQGPSPATGVVLTDQLPAGVGVAGADPGCSVSGQSVSCAVGALALGASAQRSVDVSFGTALAGQSLQDTASVTGNETDLDPTNNSASLVTTVGPAPPTANPTPTADLSLTETASLLSAGGQIDYTLNAVNRGPDTATGVVITDPLPAGVSFVKVVTTTGTCSVSARVVTCRLGDLLPGAVVAVQITGLASPSLAARALVTNAATISSATPDPVLVNNDTTISAAVSASPAPRIGLRLTKTASTPQPQLGVPFHFTITVTNGGPDPAANVIVTDPIAIGLTVTGVQTSRGSCAAAGQLERCLLGTLASGQTATITIGAVARSLGGFRNVALASADGTQSDPAAASGVAAVTVVSHHIRLHITERADRSTVKAGGTVDYKVLVWPTGGNVLGVTTCVLPPEQSAFVTAPAARFRWGQACWSAASMQLGRAHTYRFSARADLTARGSLGNAATAAGQSVATVRANVTVLATPSAATNPDGVTG